MFFFFFLVFAVCFFGCFKGFRMFFLVLFKILMFLGVLFSPSCLEDLLVGGEARLV